MILLTFDHGFLLATLMLCRPVAFCLKLNVGEKQKNILKTYTFARRHIVLEKLLPTPTNDNLKLTMEVPNER